MFFYSQEIIEVLMQRGFAYAYVYDVYVERGLSSALKIL